jgi:hypothetical protein
VAFTNDGSNNGTDRNAHIDYIKVNGSTYQAESQSTNTACGTPSQDMWRNGYIDFGTLGNGNVIVRAKGDTGTETIQLKVNDVVKATWTLSKSWTDYTYTGYSGASNIKVAFTNDGSNNGTDRNAHIDYIKVNGTTYQAESQSTNTGCGTPSEDMWWNGYIDFGSY